MPIEFTGIHNENEFFSDHYLTDVFEGDIKDAIKVWTDAKDGGQNAPHERFIKLANPYIRRVSEYKLLKDPLDRKEAFRQFAYELLDTLGYSALPQATILPDGKWFPTLCTAKGPDGTDHLWIVEVLSPNGENFNDSPLGLSPDPAFDLPDMDEPLALWASTYENAVTKAIFAQDNPPRFVMLLSMSQVILIDRNKWTESRLLRFNLSEIFSRRNPGACQAVTALLHKSHLASDAQDTLLIDNIDEESHRHARGVSQDLKYALRESIELLGNEASHQLVQIRKDSKEATYKTKGGGTISAEQLSLECLRYMYRLLFLFYIESRPDLGFAPMKAAAYRKGYSLETLRDLELIPLVTTEEKDGEYINNSINLLFKMMYDGTPDLGPSQFTTGFTIKPVKAHLFDPSSLPNLRKVSFRNETLQRVIQLMSLSKEKNGKKTRGRISYSQLGISQLGAVYETLLSYTGFFASEDLYEVKKSGTSNPDPLEIAYFVSKSKIDEYDEEEIVYEGNEPRIYPQGSFIYRLSGHNREDSASYYTPEILTKCMVKYTIKALRKSRIKKADDILTLTICEPAMGSAAFLVETVNQLADLYLSMKQKEIGETIPHDRYITERQKVRAYITDRNTYGVDLNPIAVELGQVSLWLNCIHDSSFTPWFKSQLFYGNSLIGADLAVYKISQLKKSATEEEKWYNCTPRRVNASSPRENNEIYQFLLFYPSMSIKKTGKSLSEEEIQIGIRLSKIIDNLVIDHANLLNEFRQKIHNNINIWGQEQEKKNAIGFKSMNLKWNKILELKSPYAKLLTVMNYWCALWVWPEMYNKTMPTKDQFYGDVSLILEDDNNLIQNDIFEDQKIEIILSKKSKSADLFNQKNINIELSELYKINSRIIDVIKISEELDCFHWNIEYCDISHFKGGFDVIIGNPPWVKIEWKDKNYFSNIEPKIEIRGLPAKSINEAKQNLLARDDMDEIYSHEVNLFLSKIKFLKKSEKYDLAMGGANTYKYFINLSFKLMSKSGISSLLHPNGYCYGEHDGIIRAEIAKRLIYSFHFINTKKQYMFSDVHQGVEYCINIYESLKSEPQFEMITCATLPDTIDKIFSTEKNVNQKNTKRSQLDADCQKSGIIHVNFSVMKVFNKIMSGDQSLDDFSTKIPSFKNETFIKVSESCTATHVTLKSSSVNFQVNTLWHETADVRDSGMIKRHTAFPSSAKDFILTGPIFYVSTPWAKTPNKTCKSNVDYSRVNLGTTKKDYMPRSNYKPSNKGYIDNLPGAFNSKSKVTDYYRLALRGRINSESEKTLIGSIIPKGVAHVHSVYSICFSANSDLLNVTSLFSSAPYDFLAKIAKIRGITNDFLNGLPFVTLPQVALHRTLQLNCLTDHYKDLWEEFSGNIKPDGWSTDDIRLKDEDPIQVTDKWQQNCALRSDFARRQALLEIDVLVSIALGLKLSDLQQIYSGQLLVMKNHEKNTWYDQKGQIVFTINKPGFGVDRETWEASKNLTEGTICNTFDDDTQPGGPVERTIEYKAPFTKPDRVEDYKRAWDFFYPKYGPKQTQ